jgi:hypothetical protein
MNKRNSTPLIIPVLAIALFLLPALACGSSSTTQQLSDAANQEPASDAITLTNQSDTLEPTQTTSTASEILASSAPVESVQKLTLASIGFGQDEREVGYAFILENPNSSYSLERTQYQIAAYNAEGTVVATDSGYITLILPSQRLGIAGTIFVDEGIMVAKIEAQLSDGNSVASENIPDFAVKPVTYRNDSYFAYAISELTSPFATDITNVRVSAIVYNSSGEIIGGGFTYINFILANSTTGVKVPVTSAPEVATIELFPTISGLSDLNAAVDLPSGANKPLLAKMGFGQNEMQASFGMLVSNPNTNYSVEGNQYRVTAYDATGIVLAVEEGYINVLVPSQMLGVAGDLILPESSVIARIETQLKEGRFEQTEALPSFTSESVTFMPSDFFDKVTGTIVSPYNKDITNVRVSAISYNAEGDIIGGGYTFIDFVPAGGRSAAEVSVTVPEQPTINELYATVSGLSDFR